MEKRPEQRSVYNRLDRSLQYKEMPVWVVEDEVNQIQELEPNANEDMAYYYQKMLGRASLVLDKHYGWLDDAYEPGPVEERFNNEV